MSELPLSDPVVRSASADEPAGERDLASLLLATYFVALIVVVVALLVVPIVL